MHRLCALCRHLSFWYFSEEWKQENIFPFWPGWDLHQMRPLHGNVWSRCYPDRWLVVWDNFRPLPHTIIDNEAFMDFLLTRRSVRFFKDKPVPAELLQKIVDSLSTAPFGVHPDNVEITVISDKKVIEKAWPYMSKMYIQLAEENVQGPCS